MDIYYNKYIKYKSKYVKLQKKLYGGDPLEVERHDYFKKRLKPTIFEYARTPMVSFFNNFVRYVIENDTVSSSIKNIVSKYSSILSKYNDVDNIINKFVEQIINLVNRDTNKLKNNETNIDSLLSIFQYFNIIEDKYTDFFDKILEKPYVIFIDGENILNNRSLLFGYFLITRNEQILEYILTDFSKEYEKFFELRNLIEPIIFNNLPTRQEHILYVVTTKGRDNALEMFEMAKYDVCKLTIACYAHNPFIKKECDDLLLLFLHFCHIYSETTKISKLWSYDNYNWIKRTNIQLCYFKIVFNLNNNIGSLFDFLNMHNTEAKYIDLEEFNKKIKEVHHSPFEINNIIGTHSFTFVNSNIKKINPYEIFNCVEFLVKDNSGSLIGLSRLLINAIIVDSIYRTQSTVPTIPKNKHYQLLKYIVGLYYNNVPNIKRLCERMVEIANRDVKLL